MSTNESKTIAEQARDSDPKAVKEIRLTLNDGEIVTLRLDDDTHILFGYAKRISGPVDDPSELCMQLVHWGLGKIVGEIYYQTAVREPNLVLFARKRSMEDAIARRSLENAEPAGHA